MSQKTPNLFFVWYNKYMNNKIKTIISVILIIAIGLFIYYISKEEKTETIQTAPVQVPVVKGDSVVGCYVSKLAKDVYTLQIESEVNGNFVGKVSYNNYEKDSSSGIFTGTLTGDILLGNYSFDSEGMHSNRQLIFKKNGNNFVEGFGEVKSIGDTELFANVENITYDPNSTFVKSENCTEIFTASNGSFSFNYGAFFSAAAGTNILSTDWKLNAKEKGTLLATVIIPRGYMPQTNFSEGKLTIGKSSDKTAIKNCLVNTSVSNNNTEKATVSGYPVTKFTSGDAGAGNFYETTSYRGIIGGDCYSFEYTIHSTNIGNYSPDQGIKEFDKNKIVNDLESVLKSLRLIVASN
jgi:hypothetical protein